MNLLGSGTYWIESKENPIIESNMSSSSSSSPRDPTFQQFYSDAIYDIRVKDTKKLNSMARVRERTIPTDRPPLVGEVSANFFC
jgi:hypothetical protein